MAVQIGSAPFSRYFIISFFFLIRYTEASPPFIHHYSPFIHPASLPKQRRFLKCSCHQCISQLGSGVKGKNVLNTLARHRRLLVAAPCHRPPPAGTFIIIIHPALLPSFNQALKTSLEKIAMNGSFLDRVRNHRSWFAHFSPLSVNGCNRLSAEWMMQIHKLPLMGSGSVGDNDWLINRWCILIFDDEAI